MRARPRFELHRIYDAPSDGAYRVLVDRLWPRGFTKERADLDEWLRDVAPSPELRRWFGHDAARFAAFARRYRAELGATPGREAVAHLRTVARRRRVALLTANKDLERSSAGVLFALLATPPGG